ncbi:MAG TPA: asparagine synthase-related protein [Gaiellaceae bacterium]|nr:asparagine synthase-related protein [Gaiellaceae bacterium]
MTTRHGFTLWVEPTSTGPHIVNAGSTDIVRFEDAGLTVAATGRVNASSVGSEYLRTGRLDSFDGPAAVVLHDERRGRTLAARDRTGLAPFFHVTTPDGAFGVSTDARALAARAGHTPARGSIAAWLVGAPLAPAETLLTGLSRIPAGHLLERSETSERLTCLWSPPPPGSLSPTVAAEFGSRLETAVNELVGDDLAAVLLSGGIDSSAVTAAAAVRRRPIVLSVDFAGASERKTQHVVASQLGLRRLEAELRPDAMLVSRGVDRLGDSLWPTPALWAPVFDDLVARGRSEGVRVLLDGQGGDDLLDAGMSGGAALLRRPAAFAQWALAERRYTGSAARAIGAVVKRRFLGKETETLPSWLAPDPALRSELLDRFASVPSTYADQRRLDVLDPLLSAQREETFDRGLRIGLLHTHPLWHPLVVELLSGLPPAALVTGGNPKAPALRYLRSRLQEPRGTWPRPSLADDLLGRAVAAGAPAAWERFGGGPHLLAELGVLAKTPDSRDFPLAEIVATLTIESWIHGLGGEAR